MAEQQFCLKWNNFQSNIVASFENLLDKEEFVDVTLTADGKSLKAHKILLSACSPYFSKLFRDLPSHQHPVIVLRDTSFLELKALLSFIYHGEVNVAQDRLGLLLKLAESLRIKGLAQDQRVRDSELYDHQIISPKKDIEDNCYERIERERRTICPENLPMPFAFPTVPGLNLSTGLAPLDPSSHKSLFQPSSPPSKRKKLIHSPLIRSNTTPGHTPPNSLNNLSGASTTPGHTPPGLTPSSIPSSCPIPLRDAPPLLQVTPPNHAHSSHHTTPTSSNVSSNPTCDEDKVVNLTMSGGSGGNSSPPPSSPSKLKTDGEEDSPVKTEGGGGSVCSKNGSGSSLDNENEHSDEGPPPPNSLDDDSRGEGDGHPVMNHPDFVHLPPLPVQTFVPFGATQLDTYPGPSGVLPMANQGPWRPVSSGAESAEASPQGLSQSVVIDHILGGGEGSLVGTSKKATPTPCPACGKVLSNAYNMRVHMETHQSNTTYKCIVCGMITRTRDTMRKHLSNVHKLKNIELKNSFKKVSAAESNFGLSESALNPTSSVAYGSPKHSGNSLKVSNSLAKSFGRVNPKFSFGHIFSLPTPTWTSSKLFEKERTEEEYEQDAIHHSESSLASLVNKLNQLQ